jgi:oxygen-independent coproporphyrinogen-3 oxidase
MHIPVSDLISLDNAIEQQLYSDYIYMYPPRQAYRALQQDTARISRAIRESLLRDSGINLYIHIPFCAQICRFCNLYTTPIHDKTIYERYVDRVLEEAEAYVQLDLLSGTSRWQTMYLGGGTPSALPLDLLERLMTRLRGLLQISHVEETAIEVAPETITRQYLEGLRSLGFDRVSMGFQSTSEAEVRRIGRSYRVSSQADIARFTMDLGFRNLCLDLIFGLPGQDAQSWRESVRAVIAMRPHTICCYQWTSRPHTGFDKMGLLKPGGAFLRELYEIAVGELNEAGYCQDTHVRWTVEGGGYLQKQYHWGLETLLGLGAGARSYLWQTDLRNGYSIRSRRDALQAYFESRGLVWQVAPEGFAMSDEERQRKAVVLGIHDLSRGWFEKTFGTDVLAVFGEEIMGLESRRLLTVTDDTVRLTRLGRAYRDTVVQLFFSDRVRDLTRAWDYAE